MQKYNMVSELKSGEIVIKVFVRKGNPDRIFGRIISGADILIGSESTSLVVAKMQLISGMGDSDPKYSDGLSDRFLMEKYI